MGGGEREHQGGLRRKGGDPRRDLQLKGNVSQLLPLNVPQEGWAASPPAWVPAPSPGGYFVPSTGSAPPTAGFSLYPKFAFITEIRLLRPSSKY